MNQRTEQFDKFHHSGGEIHLLREIVRTYQVLMAGFSRKMGIPASRMALMRILAVADQDIGIMDLSRLLGINAAAVTRQVKDLEKEGMVERRLDSRDGRRSNIRLSPEGRRMFAAIHDRVHGLERELSSLIGAEQMQAAAEVLGKLRAFIETV